MATEQDHNFMARAIQLANSSIYSPHPNPRVGCTIVKHGEIVGEGWHVYAGGPHAEVHALQQAGEQAQGATAYITLEPCSHFGRTPPCANALIDAGIIRVVVAMQDPNPQVMGSGIVRLRAAGIEVVSGVLEQESAQLNIGFIQRMRHARPWVISKLAMSLDGRTATSSGESKWITGADARRDVQILRAGSAAMLTGIGTVLADDPSLTVRIKENDLEAPQYVEQASQPLRVVLDSQLRMPLQAKMLQKPGKTLIFCCCSNQEKITNLQDAGAEVIILEGQQPDLVQVMDELACRQINQVMVEAGAVLNGQLLEQQLVDEIIIHMAPVLMADSAKGLFHMPALQSMADNVALDIKDIRAIGKDWRMSIRPKFY